MDKEYYKNRFDGALQYFPDDVKAVLYALPLEIKCVSEEIRLRVAKPLAVTVGGSQFFIKKSGVSMLPGKDSFTVTKKQIEETFFLMCNRSVYSHQDEIRQGYISLQGGHRAGVCGTVVKNQDGIFSVKDISSVNLRIAKEVYNCAEKMVNEYSGGGVLVCGGPGSGKTTLLRDFARQLAMGKKGKCYKVAVVDSRGEIAAVCGGIPMTDIGFSSDVLTGFPKEKGIEMAIRTLYPDIIVFDELGSVGEVNAIMESMNSGVSVVTSAHIGDLFDVFKREQTKKLIYSGAVNNIVYCKHEKEFSYDVFNVKELLKDGV